MLYFPQLMSGASVQFPLVRREVQRVVRNQQMDGREWKVNDPAGAEVSWVLRYRGLTEAECAELESLFRTVEGRRGSFVFLDPADNLLTWSEELSREAWTRDPMLDLSSGIADPFGGTGATRLVNHGTVTQRVEQALPIPSWYQYCLSAWIKSESGGEVTLFGRCGSAGVAKTVRAGVGWRRVSLPVKLGGNEELVCFGMEVGGGGSADVYGLQVEAQAGPSGYRRTRSRSGIYREARFGHDAFEVVAEGPNSHGCTVTVVALI